MVREGVLTQNLGMVFPSLISKKICKNKIMLTLGYIKDRVAATTTNIQLLKNMYFTFPLCSKIQTQSVCYLNETLGTRRRKQLAIKIPERPRTIKFQLNFNTMFLKHTLSDISITKQTNPELFQTPGLIQT